MPRLRMRGAIPQLPQYVFMARCLGEHKDNFTLVGYKGSSISVYVDQNPALKHDLDCCSSYHKTPVVGYSVSEDGRLQCKNFNKLCKRKSVQVINVANISVTSNKITEQNK
jgi:hypothetical protein